MNKKKIVLLYISISVLIISATHINASESNSTDLKILASEIIQMTEVIDMEGYVTTTYENLDVFANVVRIKYPEISEYEIAMFIGEYTQQDLIGLPENEAVAILDYDNITTTMIYYYTDSEGNIEASGTPYIKTLEEFAKENLLFMEYEELSDFPVKVRIGNSYLGSETNENGINKKYVVWVDAYWISYPHGREYNHQLLIGSGENSIFYSEFSESGNVVQTFECLNAGICDERTLIFRNVTDTNREYQELKMDYDAGVPYIEYEELYTLCSSCNHTTIQKELKAFLQYGLKLTNDTVLYVGYAYTTTEAGTITPSISIDGVPSFSYSGNVSNLHYDTSRGITLRF